MSLGYSYIEVIKNSYDSTGVLDVCLLVKRSIKKLLSTLVESDSKAPFLIATTPRCRGGRCSFPWIALLYS